MKVKDKLSTYKLISFLGTFMLFMMVLFVKNEKTFGYDASYYWNISDVVFAADGFNILQFPETFRGYFLPLLYSAIKVIGKQIGKNCDYYIFWLLHSFLVSALIVYIIPGLFVQGKNIKNIFSFAARSVLNAVMVLVFIKDIKYPLSDIPSFFFFALGFYLIKMSEKESANSTKQAAMLVTSGAFLYMSYNTRILYRFSILLLCVYVIINGIKEPFKKYCRNKIFVFLMIFIGMVVVAIPQMVIKNQYTGKLTPRVMYDQLTDYKPVGENEQILEGINRIKYDTYIGNDVEYPSAGMGYRDEVGRNLNNRMSGDFSFSKLIKLFLKYPFDIIGIYGRHLLVLMTPVSETYANSFFVNYGVMFMLSILLWFVFFLSAIILYSDKLKVIVLNSYYVALIIPALLEIADAPEIRFFYPVYFCLFGFLCWVVDWKKMAVVVKGRMMVLFMMGVMTIAMWSALYGNILMNNEAGLAQFICDDRPIYKEIDTIYKQGHVLIETTGDNVSQIVFEPITFEPNALYMISFHSDNMKADDIIYCEFVGEKYRKTMKDSEFHYDKQSNRFWGICSSANAPSNLTLNLVSRINHDVDMDNFKVDVVEDTINRKKVK